MKLHPVNWGRTGSPRFYRTLGVIGRMIGVAALAAAAVWIIGPLTYDAARHEALTRQVLAWSPLGNPLLGLDVTWPRSNVFTLVRDLDRHVRIVEHAQVHDSWLLGTSNFLQRGRLATVGDALAWFGVPLTKRQANEIKPCRPLDDLKPNEDIVIRPDPYQKGIASWYGPGFHGRTTANGETYDMYGPTAAHKTLRLGTMVRVVQSRTGQSAVVRINDRGPYVGARIIDLSLKSKENLGMEGGLASVYLEVLDTKPIPCEN